MPSLPLHCRCIVVVSSSSHCCGVVVVASLWCRHRRVVVVLSSSSHCRHVIIIITLSPCHCHCRCHIIAVLSSASCCGHVIVVIIIIIVIAIASPLLLLLLSCYCCHRHQCIFLSSVYEQHCQGIPKPGGGLDWYLLTVFPSHPFNVIRHCQILLIASLGGTQECLVAYLKYSSGAVRYIHVLE